MADTLERPILTPSQPAREHVVLRNISWETYEALLSDHADSRWPRFVYDEGTLEIMTPGSRHDSIETAVNRLIDIVAEELGIEARSFGHTTMRRKDLRKGFEGDGAWYIQNSEAVRGILDLDMSAHPPPDLVVEVEVSRSALDKLALYARMGVSEVWRCDDTNAVFHILQGTTYRESSSSIALPGVTTQALMEFVTPAYQQSSLAWRRAVREWARTLRPQSQ